MEFGNYSGTGIFDMNGLEIHDGDILCDILANGRKFLVDYCALEGKWVLVDRAGELFDKDLYGYEGLLRVSGHISDAKDDLSAYWEYRYAEAVKRADLYNDTAAIIEKRILERINIDFNLNLNNYSD